MSLGKAQPLRDTRLHLIQVGAQLLKEKGYNHTGLQEVVQRAGVPKGSFYHFFGSKEAFGLAIIAEDIREHNLHLEQFLGDRAYTPLQRLRRYFEDKYNFFTTLRCRQGCLLGNLGQELADQNEAFRQPIAQFFADWQQQLADCLTEAQCAGELEAEANPQDIAQFLLSSWEGALLQMKITQDPQPLRVFLTLTFDTVLRR